MNLKKLTKGTLKHEMLSGEVVYVDLFADAFDLTLSIISLSKVVRNSTTVINKAGDPIGSVVAYFRPEKSSFSRQVVDEEGRHVRDSYIKYIDYSQF